MNGDTSLVVPTDTQKNRIYSLAKEDFNSIEEYAVMLARRTLDDYPDLVNKITVEVKQDGWVRAHLEDSDDVIKPHVHGFTKGTPEER